MTIIRRLALAAVMVALLFVLSTSAVAHFTSGCKKNRCKRHVVKPYNDKLNRMAQCESGGRWFIDGAFDGGLQFHPGTWNATGSAYSFAYLAPIIEQKYRALIWRSKIGTFVTTAGWPRCGFA